MTPQYKGSFAAALGLIFGMGGLSASAAPQTIFTNFGPGNSYLSNNTLVEDGPSSTDASLEGDYYSQGEGFTPSVSGYLSSFNIALSNFDGTDDAHLFLADGSSGVPGIILESFTLTNLPFYNASSNTPDFVASVSHPFLNAGTTYFLYEAETGSEDNGWNQNSVHAEGLRTVSKDGGPYSTASFTGGGALSVQANPVPEPSTMVSFGLGAFGLGVLLIAAKRKKTTV